MHSSRYALVALLSLVSAAAPAANTGPAPTPDSNKGDTSPVAPPFTATPVATFDHPWAMAFLPDGRMLVTEKPGHVLLVTQQGGKSAPLAGVPKVDYGGQGGLLDIALAPDFATSHLVYLSYAEPGPGGSSLAVARGRLILDGTPRFAGMSVIWRQMPKGDGGQFGSIITFAPDGKSFFLTSGERQRKTPAQDPHSALGKILHLTLDGKPWPGNPLAKEGGVEAELWTMGHRNPYGLAYGPYGKLWEIEMGPRGGDEMNLIEPDHNYGWPVVSNGDNYDGSVIPDHPTQPQYAAPRLWWNPVISPSSLIFYSGALFPAWKGSALISGLSFHGLVRVVVDQQGHAKEAERFDMGHRIRDVVEGPQGALWVLEDGEGARLLKLTPKG